MPNILITRAIERLSIPGVWAQGPGLKDWGGSCDCVSTAVSPIGEEENTSLLYDAKHRLYEATGGTGSVSSVGAWSHIIHWNDTPGRTLDEVLAMMREANS